MELKSLIHGANYESHHFQACFSYVILKLYLEHGTIILEIIEAPTGRFEFESLLLKSFNLRARSRILSL